MGQRDPGASATLVSSRGHHGWALASLEARHDESPSVADCRIVGSAAYAAPIRLAGHALVVVPVRPESMKRAWLIARRNGLARTSRLRPERQPAESRARPPVPWSAWCARSSAPFRPNESNDPGVRRGPRTRLGRLVPHRLRARQPAAVAAGPRRRWTMPSREGPHATATSSSATGRRGSGGGPKVP
jgi:hypothetical protein